MKNEKVKRLLDGEAMPGWNTTYHIDSYTTHMDQKCFAMCCTSMVCMDKIREKQIPLPPPQKKNNKKQQKKKKKQLTKLTTSQPTKQSINENGHVCYEAVSNLITAFDKYLHIQQNCIHTMLFSIQILYCF